ncbi:MAG: N-acetylglucosamine-6-phosphate deacetylase [Nocardioidaceae bacterium]
MLLAAERIVTPARVFAPGWLRIEGDRIADGGAGVPDGRVEVDLGPVTVTPGFVDAHVHGGGGASFTDGTDDALATVVRAHRAHGTTTMVASLVTDTVVSLEAHLGRLAAATADGLVAGAHLEGPWLSPRHAGAHDASLLRDPSAADVDRLLAAGEGCVRMVTLAPELAGGLDAIRQVVGSGVVAAIGHTDATYDLARAALDAGASVGTHLFNAMRGLHQREPGPATALLEHPDAFVELVSDGVHLHPAVLRLAMTAKPHQALLVTDAMAAAAAEDGDYQLGPMAVTVRDGVARLSGSGAIAGSTLTMAAAVRYAVTVAGLPLTEVVRAATTTPATMLGLARVGALRPGYAADLVVLDRDLRVTRVMSRGRWVDGAGAG